MDQVELAMKLKGKVDMCEKLYESLNGSISKAKKYQSEAKKAFDWNKSHIFNKFSDSYIFNKIVLTRTYIDEAEKTQKEIEELRQEIDKGMAQLLQNNE